MATPGKLVASQQRSGNWPKGAKRLVLLLLWLFVLVGGAAMGYGAINILRAQASRHWPTTTGVVQQSSVKRDEDHQTTNNVGRGVHYNVDVLYEYSVAGITYLGNRVTFGDYGSTHPSHAQSIVNRYPTGKAVTVYYSPTAPQLCALEPGLGAGVWIAPGVGVAFFAGGSLFLFLLTRPLPSQPAPPPETPPQGARRLLLLAFPWPFVIVGGAMMCFGGRNILRAQASCHWPTADGIVQRSSVERDEDRPTPDHGGAGATYHAEVLYKYVVAAVPHLGNRVTFGDFGASYTSHAESIVNQYPQGKAVTVYYAPTDPDLCVLEPGLHGGVWVVPGLGAAFFVAGSFVLLAVYRFLFKKQPSTGQPPALSETV